MPGANSTGANTAADPASVGVERGVELAAGVERMVGPVLRVERSVGPTMGDGTDVAGMLEATAVAMAAVGVAPPINAGRIPTPSAPNRTAHSRSAHRHPPAPSSRMGLNRRAGGGTEGGTIPGGGTKGGTIPGGGADGGTIPGGGADGGTEEEGAENGDLDSGSAKGGASAPKPAGCTVALTDGASAPKPEDGAGIRDAASKRCGVSECGGGDAGGASDAWFMLLVPPSLKERHSAPRRGRGKHNYLFCIEPDTRPRRRHTLSGRTVRAPHRPQACGTSSRAVTCDRARPRHDRCAAPASLRDVLRAVVLVVLEKLLHRLVVIIGERQVISPGHQRKLIGNLAVWRDHHLHVSIFAERPGLQ